MTIGEEQTLRREMGKQVAWPARVNPPGYALRLTDVLDQANSDIEEHYHSSTDE